MHCLAGGERPRSLAAHTVGEGFVLGDAQLHESGGPRAAVLPALPDTHPDATADPFVQVVEEALDGHQPKVPYPALEVSTKFGAPLGKRNPPAALRDLADARLELVEILPGNAELAAVALEGEAEKLDSVGAADTALLLP